MGTCMLSKSTHKPSGGPIDQLTSSVRSQIRNEFEREFSGITFEGQTGKFQKTASYDLGLASKDIDLDEATLPKQHKLELKLSKTDDDLNSGFFQVKDGSSPLSASNEETEMGSHAQPGGDLSSLNQFSFQMKSLKPIYNEEDYSLLGGVVDERQRVLILDTLNIEKPIRLEKIVFRGGETYEGQWMGAKRHGKGKHCSPIGVYDGQWMCNKMSGNGIFQFANKDRYEGHFQDGAMQGVGRLEDRSGSIYQGDFKAGKKDGIGIEVYDHGEYYEGEWKQGYKHGKGYLQFSDGSYCRGQFMENFIHGYAEYSWAGQKCYRGEWALNKLEGKGVMEWQDGRKYEGSYANDKMEGKGTYFYRNGESFTGQWRNNKKNGKGEYTDEHGKIIRGIWYEDRLIEEYVNISSTKRCAITSLAALKQSKN